MGAADWQGSAGADVSSVQARWPQDAQAKGDADGLLERTLHAIAAFGHTNRGSIDASESVSTPPRVTDDDDNDAEQQALRPSALRRTRRRKRGGRRVPVPIEGDQRTGACSEIYAELTIKAITASEERISAVTLSSMDDKVGPCSLVASEIQPTPAAKDAVSMVQAAGAGEATEVARAVEAAGATGGVVSNVAARTVNAAAMLKQVGIDAYKGDPWRRNASMEPMKVDISGLRTMKLGTLCLLRSERALVMPPPGL